MAIPYVEGIMLGDFGWLAELWLVWPGGSPGSLPWGCQWDGLSRSGCRVGQSQGPLCHRPPGSSAAADVLQGVVHGMHPSTLSGAKGTRAGKCQGTELSVPWQVIWS